MKFTTFLHRNVSMHFAFHNHGLALHLAAHIRILPNCQNTVDRGNLALEISIKHELIFKLERAFNFDVLREVILIGWYICHIGGLVVLTVSPPPEWWTPPEPGVFRRCRLSWRMGDKLLQYVHNY